MIDFFVIEANTGRILRTGRCPTSMVSNQSIESSEAALIGQANDETDYYDIENEQVVERLDFPILIDSLSKPIDEAFLISDIPLNTHFQIQHAGAEMIDGYTSESTIELALESEGNCRIRFTHLHYKDLEITLNAY